MKRVESLQQLKDNGDEITQKEEEIFGVGRKLKKGLEENHKFQQVRRSSIVGVKVVHCRCEGRPL